MTVLHVGPHRPTHLPKVSYYSSCKQEKSATEINAPFRTTQKSGTELSVPRIYRLRHPWLSHKKYWRWSQSENFNVKELLTCNNMAAETLLSKARSIFFRRCNFAREIRIAFQCFLSKSLQNNNSVQNFCETVSLTSESIVWYMIRKIFEWLE